MKVLNRKDYRHVVLKDDDGETKSYCQWVAEGLGCPFHSCGQCPVFKYDDEVDSHTYEEAVAWWRKQK